MANRVYRPSAGASALPSIMALSSMQAMRQKTARDALAQTQAVRFPQLTVLPKPDTLQPAVLPLTPDHYSVNASRMHP